MKTPSLLGRGSLFAQFLFAEYAKSSARPASCKRKAIKAAPKAVILAILFHVIQNGTYYTLFCFVLSMGNAKKDLAIFGFCHCILHLPFCILSLHFAFAILHFALDFAIGPLIIFTAETQRR